MIIKTDFDSKKPYRVIEVKKCDDIKYKITQPLKLWLFGYYIKYYDVCEWSLRHRYKHVKYFFSKKEVDDFVKEQTKNIAQITETIVFDSLNKIP